MHVNFFLYLFPSILANTYFSHGLDSLGIYAHYGDIV